MSLRQGSTMARPELVCLLLICALPAAGMEGVPGLHQTVTVLVEVDKPIPSEAMQSMQAEIARLFQKSQRPVLLRSRADFRLGDEADELVLVRLRGECRIPPEPVFLDERGPQAFAYTHVTDGQVLPFSEVLCERVLRSAKRAMWGGEHGRANHLLGRALARVVAHELIHILTGEKSHSHDGVFQRTLTGRQLIEDGIDFAGSEFEQLRRRNPGP